MQEKSTDAENPVFQRLRRLQQGEGMKWSDVADKLGITVGMLMMVKRKRRNFSARTLCRLEQFEREIAKRKSQAERIVDGLLAGEGTAAQLVESALREELPVEYSSPRNAKGLPKDVLLRKPPEQGCARLRQLFAETTDTAVILLACLPESLRSERFLSKLTADSRIQLTKTALNLVIPEWRILAAKSTNSPG
jgi:transcriptional regulator with XRE-family HTH domain